MIIDAHTHIFPEKIAQKASGHIANFYDTPCRFDGSSQSLLRMMDKNNINKSLVLSAATSLHQVSSINDFIHEEVQRHPDRFIGFFTLHPDMDEVSMEKECSRALSFGLKGIKLHPDFQSFAIDSPRTAPIYALAQERGIPILFHAGDRRYAYSNPHRIAKIMLDFPHLSVIAAHFGGWSEWDEAIDVLAGKENLFVDTSSTRAFIPLEKIKKSVHAFGIDSLFFGTDYPMWSAGDELPFIDRLGFTEGEKEKVLYKNICNLLKI